MEITFPIILNDNGDLDVFPNLKALTNYIEPVAVSNREYKAYDANGWALALLVIEHPEQRGPTTQRDNATASHIYVKHFEPPRNEEGELIRLISQFLMQTATRNSESPTIGLGQLVRELSARVGKPMIDPGH